jgi:hypothetical protein
MSLLYIGDRTVKDTHVTTAQKLAPYFGVISRPSSLLEGENGVAYDVKAGPGDAEARSEVGANPVQVV